MENKETRGATRRKLILVDDVAFHLMSTKERLKKHYEVYPAQSAEAMYELLENIKPELILLDVNMPDSSGYDVIKQLKKDSRYAEIPVIFLTSKDDKASVLKGMTLGAVDWVRKPFTDTDLYECIEYQLEPTKRDKNKPVILAVDDSPSILASIKYLLGKKYTLYTLEQSQNLTMLLDMINPDLFMLDCNMPVLSGFDLVKIIREHKNHSETPIVFLTSEGTIDNLNVAITLGACDFITKPIDDDVLHEKIATHLKDFIMMRRLRSQKG